jgi:non-specific serine/threonine protein kinase
MLKTLSGRGYRLLGTWTIRDRDAPPQPQLPIRAAKPTRPFATNVPVAASALLGREAIVRNLADLLSAYRILTLTGPGGIGKTVLAAEIARRQFPSLQGDAWFVEFASLSDPELLPTTVATTLGLQLGGSAVTAVTVAEAIGNRRVLLVLDNCEHVVDAAAAFVETLTRNCPHCTILVTSREVLRADGECVYRVPALDVPAEDDDPDSILTHSAVELFVTRARDRDSDFAPHPETIAAAAAICRHLDGIPLAIEFAAARAAALGVQQVEAGLGDRFAILTSSRRTALPRHQTLRAVLNWSYELLPDQEKRLLHGLSLFPAGFTLDGAAAVMASNASIVAEAIENLVLKSLVVRSKTETVTSWYLLETTRAYAREKLEEGGEARNASQRQAEFYRTLFAPFDGQLQSALDNLASYRRELDNVRAALDWAFSADGDAAIGIALAAATADFWAATWLLAEGCEWAGIALSRIGTAGTRSEMILQCSLGMTLIYTKGMIDPARAALSRALILARTFEDPDYQQRTTMGLWLFAARSSALRDALSVALPYEASIRPGDRQSLAIADWLIGIPNIYFANHAEATTRLRRAIDQYPIDCRGRDMLRFGGDLYASASGHVSVSLLSQGRLDEAMRAAERAVEEAHIGDQPTVLCVALVFAGGFVALSLDDLDMAERYGEGLILLAQKHALAPYHAAGLCIRGSLASRRNAPETGADLLRRGLSGIQASAYFLFYPFFLVEFAAALGASGRVEDGLAELDSAMRFAEDTGHRWFVPETLRVRGDLLVRRGSGDPASVMALYQQAMDQAREQNALYWELSAAISLAEFMRGQDRDMDVEAILRPVHDRFTQGFAAHRLRRAAAMLG